MSNFSFENKKLNEDQQERLYAISYGLYECGNYTKAANFFSCLIFHNPFDVRFWKGLAAAKQMEPDYQAAIHAWSILALLAPQDPSPHFHAAECFISIDNRTEALKALACAENLPNAPKEKIDLLKTLLFYGNRKS